MDPPWPNKSARRSSSYEDIDIYDLYSIELPTILAHSATFRPVLVACWLTNHPKYRSFVKEKLFPAWQIEDLLEWYWVKITAREAGKPVDEGGLPVWSLDGKSPRRCYEGMQACILCCYFYNMLRSYYVGLVLGWYNPNDLPIPRKLDTNKAFLSVPLGHSRKPLILGRGFASTRA